MIVIRYVIYLILLFPDYCFTEHHIHKCGIICVVRTFPKYIVSCTPVYVYEYGLYVQYVHFWGGGVQVLIFQSRN
jgi:hypothetical protein